MLNLGQRFFFHLSLVKINMNIVISYEYMNSAISKVSSKVQPVLGCDNTIHIAK